jgi:hypothetical protein
MDPSDPKHVEPQAAHEPAAPPSDDVEAILRAQKKQRVRFAVVAVAGLVAIGAGVAALFARQDRAATERIDKAFGGLSRCLLGPPLETGETAGSRVRRVQLSAMTMADEQRSVEAGKPWPERCATFAFQVDEAIRDAARGKGDKDLAHAAAALGKLLEKPTSFEVDMTPAVNEVFSLAPLENVSPGPAVDVAVAPGRADPLDADALARGTALAQKAFSFQAVYTEPHPALDMHVLVDDPGAPGAPFLCTMRKASAEARCAKLPGSIAGTKQGLRLLGTTDDGAAPLVFAGSRGSEGIFRADTGVEVERYYAYGGYAAADFAAVLGWREKDKELVASRKQGGGATTQTKIDPPFRVGNPYYSAQMLWDAVMLRGVTKEDRRRLFALPLARGGAVVGDPIDVGELPEPGLVQGGADEPPHITGCKTAETLVVRVKGYDVDFMSFRLGGRWSEPISPGITGGTLSCSHASSTVTRVEPADQEHSYKTSIRQAHCTSAGCRTDVVRMEALLHKRTELAPRDGHVDAADLDGKLLVVWAAGERGGVRLRLGPIESIASAPDVVIFDDMIKDGQVGTLSTFFDLNVFSREGFALVLLGTTSGVHGLRVDPDGKLTPVTVTKG